MFYVRKIGKDGQIHAVVFFSKEAEGHVRRPEERISVVENDAEMSI
jgi:hypothetical protein